LFPEWLANLRDSFFQADFFRILFLLLRAPPANPVLYLELSQIQRRISDVLLANGLHEDLSLLGRFVVIFGGSFHVSRGLFSGVCAHALFGNVGAFSWVPNIQQLFPRKVIDVPGSECPRAELEI
jgi:hypothetical protein